MTALVLRNSFNPNKPAFATKEESHPKTAVPQWFQVASTSGALATAITLSTRGIVSPSILTGSSVGALTWIVHKMILGGDSPMTDEEHPWESNLLAPIEEEVQYRLLLQNFIYIIIADFTHTQAETAVLVSILAAGILFGIAHAQNEHETKRDIFYTVIRTSIMGIILGALYQSYGFEGALSCHLMHNTLCTVEQFWRKSSNNFKS